MHDKILNAVHVEHKRLVQEDAIVDWVGKNGLNRDEFMAIGIEVAPRLALAFAADARHRIVDVAKPGRLRGDRGIAVRDGAQRR